MSNRIQAILLVLLVLLAATIVVRDLRKPPSKKSPSLRETYSMPIAQQPPPSN